MKAKEKLTLLYIKKQNISFQRFVKIMIFISSFAFIYSILIDYFIIGIPFLIFIIILIKLRKKINKNINDANFNIIEDKIYDKYYVYNPFNTSLPFKHYIFSKIYGELSVSAVDYNNAKKDDTIYILIYNSSNKNIDVDDIYIASMYEISDELMPYFVPYDEKLGEANFNARINEQISKLEKEPGKVVCKTCKTKYNASKQISCTTCGSKYKFDIVDVMHEKGWYK